MRDIINDMGHLSLDQLIELKQWLDWEIKRKKAIKELNDKLVNAKK